MAENIDAVMQTIPVEWRTRWCNAIEPGGGGCACMGCVQIGNRISMAREAGYSVGDPEYVNESVIPRAIFDRLKVTKEEWSTWMARQTNAVAAIDTWPDGSPM